MINKKTTILTVFIICIAVFVSAIDKQDAISGANIDGVYQHPSSQQGGDATDIADGGQVNIVEFDNGGLNSQKWQLYYGSVTAELRLGTSDNLLFDFGVANNSQIKTVFASTDSAFNFGSLNKATGPNVDTVYDFNDQDTDSGTNVYNDTNTTIARILNVPAVRLNAHTPEGELNNTLYQSGVFKDDGSIVIGGFSAMSYGVAVNPNKVDYRNISTIDFELFVPVNSSGQGQSQTFYFFLDVE